MTSSKTYIAGIAYELGECFHNYEELPQFHETARAFGMSDDPALWGLGQYRRTTRDRAELAINSARLTLSRSGLASEAIDALVLCAVSFPAAIAQQVDFTNAVTSALQLADKPIFALTLNRCATMLVGLQMARSLILGGEFRNILVIAADAAETEEERFERFAIFSDGAASCVVSSTAASGYEIQKTAWKGEAVVKTETLDIGTKLAHKVTEDLNIPGGAQSVSHVFHDNLFIPIVTLREEMAGFATERLFLSNISRIGHCFSCDPLINLFDCETQTPLAHGTSLLLACSTPGIRAALLLNKIDSTKPDRSDHVNL